MHINQCSKCGQTFETKNPKRIVCPNCLYLDRAAAPSLPPAPPQQPYQQQPYQQPPRYPQQQGGYGGGYPQQQPYQQQPYQQRPQRPPYQQHQQGYGGGYPQQQGGYGPPRPQGGGPRGPYQQQRPGGYGPPGGGYQQHGGPMQPQRPRGFGPPGGGRPGPGGRPGGRPMGGPRGGFGGPRRPPKKLLVPKEALFEIEKRYKAMLPLPNPDAHVVIGQELNMEPNKVFFGINLIRQKMRLPKLDYPKRPLAVTEEQLMAVKALYEPYLQMPLPPIGVHKIIAKQLRMDEWRVHVAIGLLRKQMNLSRWNEDRTDLPEKMKEELEAAAKEKAAAGEPAPVEKAEKEKPAPKSRKKAAPAASAEDKE